MTQQSTRSQGALRRTPLHDLHVAAGARMVPFAGYDMPVQYPRGVLSEHVWTRDAAGLFDVSHMGQAVVHGPDHAAVSAALEALMPGDFRDLAPGAIRYSMLLNDDGGIVDDLMVSRPAGDGGRLGLVVNAARKDVDYARIEARLPAGVALERIEDRGLIALQGPQAAGVMARHGASALDLSFMQGADVEVAGIACHVSRSGYTGEDGFEISVPAARAGELWLALAGEPEVEPIGLGARDSLRLEAGLCLYGHDIDETTSPVEAALVWAVSKRRRAEGGFPGHGRIARELAEGPARRRVGIRPDGRAPAREGTAIAVAGDPAGAVTSGGFGPSVGGPVAMGYVAAAHAGRDTALDLMVRGRAQPARVVALPFVPHRYARST